MRIRRIAKVGCEIEVNLHFCKDILNVDAGRNLLSSITHGFEGKEWQLITQFNIFSYDPSDTTQESTVGAYLNEEWKRVSDDSKLVLIQSIDDAVSVRVMVPSRGGSALLFNRMGSPYFNQGYISLSFSSLAAKVVEESVLNFISHLALVVEASYGCAFSFSQQEVWRLDHRMMGVYWLTLFGPDVVQLVGREKFDVVSCYRKQWLTDGTLLMQLTAKFDESLTPKGEHLRQEAMKTIGLEWFRDRTDLNWYPELRNLVIPSSG